MRRLLFLIGAAACCVAWPATADAQKYVESRALILSRPSQCETLDVRGTGTGSWDLQGTGYSGTVSFYVVGGLGTQNAVDVAKADTPSTFVNSTTANGTWSGPTASYAGMRACTDSGWTGQARLFMSAAGTGGGSGGGGGGGGAVTVGDGDDAALGAVADAVATQGGTGTISAKLRLVTSQLNTTNTSLGSLDNAVGPIAGAATATGALVGGGQYNTTLPTLTNGQQAILQLTAEGRLMTREENSADIETVLGSIDNNIDTIRTQMSTDASHGSAAILTGPGVQCESKVIDAGALPNLVTEGQSARIACTLAGLPITVLSNIAGSADLGAAISASLALLDDLASFEDEDAFTYTTSKVAPVGAVAESTTDAIADGLVGALTMDTARRLIVTPTPTTYGGLSIYRSIDLDEGTGEVIKNAAGQLYSLWVTNTATATRFIKIYNATSCTMGTGTPVITVGIPGNSSDDVAGQLTAGGVGIEFTTGICFGATTGVADADTGAPGANEIIANAFYK